MHKTVPKPHLNIKHLDLIKSAPSVASCRAQKARGMKSTGNPSDSAQYASEEGLIEINSILNSLSNDDIYCMPLEN